MLLSILASLVVIALTAFVTITQRKKQKGSVFTLDPPSQSKPHWKGKRIENRSVRIPGEPEYIQCYCPATGQFLGKFLTDSEKDINNKVGAAKKAQKAYRSTTFDQRRQVLLTIKNFICENQEKIVRVACRDSGKTVIDASMGEVLVTLEKIAWIIQNGEKALSTSVRPGPSNILMRYKKAEVRYEPLGTVAAMVSWNYPFHNLMGPIVAALFTGNACIVKCSEQVLWSSQWFIQIAQLALKSCGLDSNLVQLVCTFPEMADTFTSHPEIDHITFIGSQPVAKKVCRAASDSLTPLVVELGGKDAVVVCDDYADLQSLSSILMRGTFQSSGQNCIGIERVIAVGEAYTKLVDILALRVPQLRLGSGIDQLEDVDMGAMISDGRFGQIESLIEQAVTQGARLICGGHRFIHPNYPHGHFFEPTLLVDVTPDMGIAQNEIFGPVLLMMKAQNESDAIDIINSTEFALGASVFSGNFHRANRLTDSIFSGNVAINDFATFYLCQLPFGGAKQSGYGKFGGEEGLRGLCLEKSVCYDKLSFIKTSIPKSLDYPIQNGKRGWAFVESLNMAGYGEGLWQRAKAVIGLARNG